MKQAKVHLELELAIYKGYESMPRSSQAKDTLKNTYTDHGLAMPTIGYWCFARSGMHYAPHMLLIFLNRQD